MSRILNKEAYKECIEKVCKLAEKQDFMFVSAVSPETKQLKSKFRQFDTESGLITSKVVEIPNEAEHYVSVKDTDLFENGTLDCDKSVEDQVDVVMDYIEKEVFSKGNAAVLSLLGLQADTMIADNIKAVGANTNVIISKTSDNEYSLDLVFDSDVLGNKNLVFLKATVGQADNVIEKFMCD